MVADTYTSTLGLILQGTGNNNNSWGSNLNTSDFQITEDAIAVSLTSSVTGGTLDLSGTPPPAGPSGARYAGLIFTGTLGSNQVVQVPNLSKWWWVANGTSGAFTLKFKTPAGSASVAIPQNSGWQIVQCDGANGIGVSPFNSKTVQMFAGTAAAPAYSFIDETNSGWYRSAANVFKFSVAGVDVLTIGTAGPSFADGAVTAPGIAFASELGTGLYRISAGNLGFAVLGVKVAQVSATQFAWLNSTSAGSDLSPSAISTSQNDYSPTSAASTTSFRLNITAQVSITGLAGGAAGREVSLVNIGTATGVFPANSASSSAANRFAVAFNLAPQQSISLRYDSTSSLWRPKNFVVGAVSMSASRTVALAVDNTVGNENTRRLVTADEAVLVDTNGFSVKFAAVSVTIDYTTTGANGCDVGTRAANTDYYEYLISDGVTIAGLASTNASTPTMPTGYIYKKRVGFAHTDVSSNLKRISIRGNRGWYKVVAATNTANLPIVVTGTSGSVTVPTWTATSLVGLIPSTAVSVRILISGQFDNTGSGVAAQAAPNNAYGAYNSTTNPPVFSVGSAVASAGGNRSSIQGDIVLESTSIYYAASGTTHVLAVVGWEDSTG